MAEPAPTQDPRATRAAVAPAERLEEQQAPEVPGPGPTPSRRPQKGPEFRGVDEIRQEGTVEDREPSGDENLGSTMRRQESIRRASAARASAMTVKVQRIADRLEHYLDGDREMPHGKWVYETKRKLCREFRVTEETLMKIIRHRLGKRGGLDAMRRDRLGLKQHQPESQLDPKQEEQPTQETPQSITTRWNVIDLFDRLAQHFDAVVKDDDKDELEDEGDKRRTWVAWRVFLAAAFGIALSYLVKEHVRAAVEDDESDLPDYCAYPGVADESVPRGAAALPPLCDAVEIFRKCTGRMTWPEGVRSKIVSLVVGRRGGKSYITAVIGIYLAVCCTYKLKLGTKGMVMILARDKMQAGVIRGYIIAFLEVLPEIKAQFADDPTQSLIEFSNGITIEVRAVGDAGTRGYTVVAALCDEIAFWPTDPESAKQDKKVLRAIRPAMWTIKNSMIVMLSSPYAKRGELYESWRKGFGKEEQRRYFVWHADTLSMHPADDPDLLGEIVDEYGEDPEAAASEYGAQFRSDLENAFSQTAIEAVCMPGRIMQPRREGVAYRAFVDPSGGHSDSYTLAIGHDEQRKTAHGESITVPVLDFIYEEIPRPKFDPAVVSANAIAHCKAYGVATVIGDAYGGEWPRDPFQKAGITYELSDKNKSELYKEALVLVNSGRCELLDPEHHVRMVNQFVNLERRVGRTGKDSIDHPPGAHDDVANAVAGLIVTKGGASQECTW